MTLDSSALLAILLAEAGSLDLVDQHDRFGRARHPAALNFGDCLAYAVAATAGDALLFVGNDFAKTDIPKA